VKKTYSIFLTLLILAVSLLEGTSAITALGTPQAYKISDHEVFFIGENEQGDVIWSMTYITQEQAREIRLWDRNISNEDFHLIPTDIIQNYYGKESAEKAAEMDSKIPFQTKNDIWTEAQKHTHSLTSLLDRIWITTMLGADGPIINILGTKGEEIESQTYYIKQNSETLEDTSINFSEGEEITGLTLFPKINKKLTNIRKKNEAQISPDIIKQIPELAPGELPFNPPVNITIPNKSTIQKIQEFKLSEIPLEDLKHSLVEYWYIASILLLIPVIVIMNSSRKKQKQAHDQIVFAFRKLGQTFKGEIQNHEFHCDHPPFVVAYKKKKFKHFTHSITIYKERETGEEWTIEAWDGKQKQNLQSDAKPFYSGIATDLEIISSEGDQIERILPREAWIMLNDAPPFRNFHITVEDHLVTITFHTKPNINDDETINTCIQIAKKMKDIRKGIHSPQEKEEKEDEGIIM